MVKHTYYTKGTCSTRMDVQINNGIIENVAILGGCNGSLKGICALIKGMKAEDAIERMRGIRCGMKPTSCPDQLACALEEALAMDK